MTTTRAADERNLRLAIDNQWNAIKQLEILEIRLRKAGDRLEAGRVSLLISQLKRINV